MRSLLLALSLALPAEVLAQASLPDQEKALVVEIHVEGLRRVEREAALAGIKSKEGAPYDADLLTSDLRAVWQTGFFRDVRIEREAVPGGWRIIFVLAEKPSVREVKYEGNDDLSDDEVKGVVDVKPYTILNVELLKKNLEKIKDLYVQKGYYLAEVDYRIDPVKESPQEVDVIFTIVENAKVIVKEISFIGNTKLSDEQLKGVLQTREGGEMSFLTQSGTYKEEIFQTDLFRIQALYYDHGYVSVKVGEPTATISADRRYIYLSVPITEGLQYDIGKLVFSGDLVLKDDKGNVIVDEEKLRQSLNVKSGETFNRTKLFNDIQALTDVYRDQGYAYANVTPNSAIRDDVRKVDLDLEVEHGEKVYFERIEVTGNTRTRDKVIRRELEIIEGELYSATKLNKSRARVYALGHFETVNITTSRGTKPELMNVTIEVKEKSTGTFQVGAGFSSVESFILTAQISNNNFLGNGWLLSLSAQLSFGDYARKLATLQFYDPYFLDTEWSFGLDAYSTQRFYRDFERNSIGASPRLGYPLTDDLRLSAGYTLERIEISSEGATSAGLAYYNLNRDGLNSAVNLSLAYDTRDNRLFPSSGQYHVLSGEMSDPKIGSDPGLAYRRVQLFGRYYHALPFSTVLKLNGELGWVFSNGELPVPISERFFPGGIYSVRGFEPRALGPTRQVLVQGDPSSQSEDLTVGGDKQAVFNLEIEFPIIEAAGIKGVVFTDAGNAYDDDESFFYSGEEDKPKGFMFRSNKPVDLPLGLYYSFGFGFRWFSPIGPLRFEWGIPITKRRPTDRELIFEFTIGNFF